MANDIIKPEVVTETKTPQTLQSLTKPVTQSTGIQKYLDSALTVLQKLGIASSEGEESRLVTLLEDVRDVDEARVLAIAQTIRYTSTFNEMVRNNVEEMRVADRYNQVTGLFDSIVTDSKRLVVQLSDGKIDWKEKASNAWMKIMRGTTHDRFEKIRGLYGDVQTDTKDQLDREAEILGAYGDYRLAVKGAEAIAYDVLKKQEGNLEESRKKLEGAAKALESSTNDPAQNSRLELARDEAKRVYDTEDRKYQLIKDVAENLRVGYNVSDTLMVKLKQTHDAKDAVYRRSVTFFETNETVFTTLDAIFTSQKGLHEITQAQEAMIKGAEKGIEAVAEVGTGLESEALKAAYGKTYSVESVQKLIDAVVGYQTESVKLIGKYRQEATENAKAIRDRTEEARKTLVGTITKYLPEPTLSAL
ncbi:Uncharacterised protein [uncultured archaeon]|nr:Uncharacterised protein [uncultured archaeon]